MKTILAMGVTTAHNVASLKRLRFVEHLVAVIEGGVLVTGGAR